jgi:SAM-dependent methyltransferase
MTRPSWAPPEIDLNRPSAARVYDYYLGGFHNFPADRAMAQEAIRMWPELPVMMQANRAFLRRAIRHSVRRGISQFLDIGSGIPTVGNSHEVARQANPECRVVYVDIDPIAVAHSRAILGDDPATVVLQGDLRQPDAILSDERVRGLLDFERPVGVLLVALLHFIPDTDDPRGVIGRLRDVLAPGSMLIISHASSDGQPELAARHQQLYARTPTPMTMRSKAEIESLFDGFVVEEPGVVPIQRWHPDPGSDAGPEIERMVGFAGVGIKETAR